MERNKKIIDYDGRYLISNYGYVTSIKTNKRLKTHLDKEGYEIVGLCKNGKSKTYRLHRLVAIHFIKNVKNLPEVNHKDENKLNNNVSNLEWCTRIYNANYGNIKRKMSDSRTNFILIQRDLQGKYIKTWYSLYDLKLNGFNYQKIRDQIRKNLKPKEYIWQKEFKI